MDISLGARERRGFKKHRGINQAANMTRPIAGAFRRCEGSARCAQGASGWISYRDGIIHLFSADCFLFFPFFLNRGFNLSMEFGFSSQLVERNRSKLATNWGKIQKPILLSDAKLFNLGKQN